MEYVKGTGEATLQGFPFGCSLTDGSEGAGVFALLGSRAKSLTAKSESRLSQEAGE